MEASGDCWKGQQLRLRENQNRQAVNQDWAVRQFEFRRSLWHYRLVRAPRGCCPTDSLWIACESDAGELPAFFRLKEIAIGAANVSAGRRAGTAPQDILVAHEFAVVFAERTRCCAIAGIRRVGAARPFPYIAEYLVKLSTVF